jgi:hypothetical protein
MQLSATGEKLGAAKKYHAQRGALRRSAGHHGVAGAVLGATGLALGGAAVASQRRDRAISKAYTPGTITYHSAQATEEGRRQRQANKRTRTGAAVAAGGAALHVKAPEIAEAMSNEADKKSAQAGANDFARKVLRNHNVAANTLKVRNVSRAGVAAGAGIAATGIAGSALHGHRRKKNFEAAQQGRLKREPAIAIGKSNQFGIIVNSSEHEISKNYALTPRRTVGEVKGQKTIRKALHPSLEAIKSAGEAVRKAPAGLERRQAQFEHNRTVKRAFDSGQHPSDIVAADPSVSHSDVRDIVGHGPYADRTGRSITSGAIRKGINPAALDDVVLAPMKVKNAKNNLSGKGQQTPPAGSTPVTPTTGKTKGTVSSDIAQVSNASTPQTNAFGIQE